MQLHCISVRWRAAGLRPLGAPLLFVMRTNVVAHLAVGWPARASSVLRFAVCQSGAGAERAGGLPSGRTRMDCLVTAAGWPARVRPVLSGAILRGWAAQYRPVRWCPLALHVRRFCGPLARGSAPAGPARAWAPADSACASVHAGIALVPLRSACYALCSLRARRRARRVVAC